MRNGTEAADPGLSAYEDRPAVGTYAAVADAHERVETAIRAIASTVRPPAPRPEATEAQRLELINADLRRWQMAINVCLDAERQRGNQHVSLAGAHAAVEIKRHLDVVALGDGPLMLEPYAAQALGRGFGTKEDASEPPLRPSA
jgi:hypothetical protein